MKTNFAKLCSKIDIKLKDNNNKILLQDVKIKKRDDIRKNLHACEKKYKYCDIKKRRRYYSR